MITAMLGSITLGVLGGLDYLTGPKSDRERFRNTYARHDVISGKPVLQEIGRELDERNMSFFFDETFCNPVAQWARLWAAYQMKMPLPFVSQAGFAGMRYVVEGLEKDNQKTTRSGVIVRIEATMTLIEAPLLNPLDSLMQGMGAGLKNALSLPLSLK
ncbi:phage tail protein [Candidatus Tokpelaia sp.]|uniref:phage tail protein n=1 Tax=Candidatus Tokpelaia sp. TaxID=2233777 RepID=UPI001239CC2E|nr:phage tail protein [Candidatus Tokpelaia sp.]KAA6404496.1 hypothetical protein DPQ22_09705 [Candidatus Tokpelaia sp.]